MIDRDDEEIKKEFRNTFRPKYGGEPEVHVYQDRDRRYVSVEVEHDNSMTLTLKDLIKISEFFGTTNINEETQYSSGGCDTCDYGSVYTLRFVIKPEED